MKRNVILLVDADADTCAATLVAAATAGFDVRFAQIERDLCELSQYGFDDIAVIVVDYDPDVHGLAITELLDHWQPTRPLILVSSHDGLDQPLTLIGGNARHLTKPVTVPRLVHAIETAVADADAHALCCDRWGHPSNGGRIRNSVPKTDQVAA